MPIRKKRVGTRNPEPTIRLSPPGKPEIICKVCGGLRTPRICIDCYNSGRIYRKQEITDEYVRMKIANARKEQLKQWREAMKVARKTKEAKRRMALMRSVQIKYLDKLISDITSCFLRGPSTEWQFRKDHSKQLKDALDVAEVLLPKIRKSYCWPDKKRAQAASDIPSGGGSSK